MSKTKEWDKSSFLSELEREQGSDVVSIFLQFYEWSRSRSSISWQGSTKRVRRFATFWPWIMHEGDSYYPPVCFRVDGKVEVPFRYMNESEKPPFKEKGRRRKLQDRLNRIPNIKIESNAYENDRPTFSLFTLGDNRVLTMLCEVFDWYIDEIIAPSMFPDEVTSPQEYFEGATKQVSVNRYERNSAAREKCISHYGTICQVCGFDFEVRYGELGEGYIHVHHSKPLSKIGEKYRVDPIRDLCPVCPNCHAMLHRRRPPFTVDEIREMMKKQER